MKPSILSKLILLLTLCVAVMANAQETTSGSDLVNQAEVQALISEVEVDESLAQAEKDELLAVLKRTEGYLKNAASYRKLTEGFEVARDSAGDQAKKVLAEVEEAVSREEDVVVEFETTMVLADLDRQLQKDKADLATENARLDDVKSKIVVESTRANEVRLRLAELKKVAGELEAQPVAASTATSSNLDKAQRWEYVARIDANQAETQMLDAELLSQPMRVELLKAQQDQSTYKTNLLGERIKAFELYVIKLRQEEAEKALSEAESVAQKAEGKHPLILELATANAQLSGQSSKVTADLEEIRAQEVKAREQAKRYEDDLQSIELKLEIVGMSQALGQVLREQQNRLPQTAEVFTSATERERKISSSSLRQLEYEDERRRIGNIRVYLESLAQDYSAEELEPIQDEVKQLAQARRELLVTAIDLEESYLRALGDLDFTARRLVASAESYSAFISERLLWIRTSAPFSFSTILGLGHELVVVLEPGQWIRLSIEVVEATFGSVLLLVMFLLVGLMIRFRKQMLNYLRMTGDQVGNVETDKLRYSFFALGITCLLALRWPFLMYTVGLAAGQVGTELGHITSDALMRAARFFYGFEVVRHLTIPEGLFRRHFHWGDSTLQSLAFRLRALEQAFVPLVVLAIIGAQFYNGEGDSPLSVTSIIIAQGAIALFFARLPNFMQGRLDSLLIPGTKPLSSFWSRAVRALLIAIPILLIITSLMGYSGTAVQFLVLLLLTVALFAGILLANEFGMRWLRLLRLRYVKAEREQTAAEEARREATAEIADELTEAAEKFDEPDPNVLDDDGRKLLASVLGIVAIFGVWAVWSDVLPALGILNNVHLWNQTVTLDGQETIAPVTLADLGVAILVGFLGYVAIQRMPGILEVLLRQRMDMAAGTVYAIRTLFHYGLITVVVVAVLGILGGSWSQIQWAVAALSVGIGFGLQEIVANFISGLILLFEQPIRVGDTVTVGNTSGVVTKIRMRATTIRDWDRFELLVPNKEFITGRLLNWSLSDHVNRVVVEVGVAYGTNLKQAMELAVEAAEARPEILDDPKPFITFDDFGDNSMKLVLRCYLGSVDTRLTTASELRYAINDKFREAGIVIAFPQRSVHLDTSSPLAINLQPSDTSLPTK